MVELPENNVSIEDLIKWDEISKELKRLKVCEITLRKKIFDGAFNKPVEGVNTYDLANGYVLKGNYKLSRKVDQGAFDALQKELRGKNINPDGLVDYKPTIVMRAYNKLTDEEMDLFDQCLVIKPATPSLEIVLPKTNKT